MVLSGPRRRKRRSSFRASLGSNCSSIPSALPARHLYGAGERSNRPQRASVVGVYRLWRDLGYVAGALLAGVLADAFGIPVAINVIGALTAASGVLVAIRLRADPRRTVVALGAVSRDQLPGVP